MDGTDDRPETETTSAELSEATDKYLARKISPAEYLKLQQSKIPSAATMLRSLNEHPEYVSSMAKVAQVTAEE